VVSWKPVKTLVRGQLVVHLIWGCGAAQKRRQVWHLWKTNVWRFLRLTRPIIFYDMVVASTIDFSESGQCVFLKKIMISD
jgi:hypothetical protein